MDEYIINSRNNTDHEKAKNKKGDYLQTGKFKADQGAHSLTGANAGSGRNTGPGSANPNDSRNKYSIKPIILKIDIMETEEKIKDGTIRIENGKLTGLGCGKMSVNISALDELIDGCDPEDYAKSLSQVLQSLAKMGLILIPNLQECDLSYANDIVPSTDDLYRAELLSKMLNEMQS
tara:strand:+ start:5903 stop:6433 length:531 start_codon:yes stop_codon:yes gene_type:complete